MRLKYFLLLIFLACEISVPGQIKKINIDGAEITYVERGVGATVILVHGSLEDYRTWEPQLDSLSKKYHVIAYSRRFNYPNPSTGEIKDFSVRTEADDLAQLIVELKLQPAHLVGHSFGGLISLVLAIDHPQMVESLTLSEPPIINWLPEFSDGKQLYDEFYNDLWQPVKKAFDQKDTPAVLHHTLKYFYGADLGEKLPREVRTKLVSNFPEWRAIAYSTNAFSFIEKEKVVKLKMPVLLLSAGQTIPLLQLTNAELKRLLPKAQNFQLADGTHDYWMTHPRQMGDTLINFLRMVSKK